MKKLSLALAVALAATSGVANAATIYKQNGLTFKIDGDIQGQLRQRIDTSNTTEERVQVDFDDSEFKNKISYDLGNGYKAFAEAHFDAGKDKSGTVKSEETFVGFAGENFNVRLGRMDYATHKFATEQAIEEPTPDTVFDAASRRGTDVLLAKFEAGAVAVIISHDFGAGGTVRNRNTTVESTDIYVEAEITDNFSLGFAGQTIKADLTQEDSNAYGINAKIKAGTAKIAIDYSKRDDTAFDSDDDLVGLKMTNASVKFPIAKSTKATLGMTNQSNRADSVNDFWYANVIYKFPQAKKVSVFAEIQDSDANGSDAGFLAGMRVKF